MKICEFREGDLCLETIENAGMEFDLVFAAGATTGDPLLIKQREQMERIVKCVSCHDELLEALKTSKLFFEAMIDQQRCGDMFTAAALTLDKISHVINKAEGRS